jgi:hypothetical protein
VTLADYQRRNDQCAGCHKDPHASQFDEHYPTCTSCHTVERFTPSTLGPSAHPKSYPLLGGHLAVGCNECHKIDERSGIRRFKGTATACKDCHSHPHGRQFDEQMATSDCIACHRSDFSMFKIDVYRHENMRSFFLGKGHAPVDCRQCHERFADSDGTIVYTTTPTECSACHIDVHRGQFSKNKQVVCGECHSNYDRWTADQFNHDRDSTFILDKAHAKVECAACHPSVAQPDGQPVVQYKPLSSKCEDCHGFQKR